MGFFSRLFRQSKPEQAPPAESEDPPIEEEYVWEDPTLQAVGGPRYALSQILRDFEGFGLYDIGAKKPKCLGSVSNPAELDRAIGHTLQTTDGRTLYLGARYEGTLVLFHR